ncbi:hypothetical protein KVR01_008015 [Diaporthe batatas]|uniref:uncharacterized protein n=1 Tax=Diaporthe batatas TaxID=748121 RepID=UPI001D04D007|nr:uncharacterized protein KVR01_008015 [Diaporthe batatas]KAG8162250.1 hypothetical protein KVR01_008015 [Diaporthe batatas]
MNKAEERLFFGKKFPNKKNGDPSWKMAIQVGVDGTGLQGSSGEFPQICLWNIHGQIIGYNDQTIRIADPHFDFPFPKPPDPKFSQKYNDEIYREDMPTILNGGLNSVGIWPMPDNEDMGKQQAVYVTMIKRHFDAICVASVILVWPDGRNWVFYAYTSDKKSDGACFWLDHRGDLKHTKDLEEEYIGANLDQLGRKPKKEYPSYLWASNVKPETGLPEGEDLNGGMRENGVHEYKVPLGVKFKAPSFFRGSYGDELDNMTVDDFVTNPAKIRWITRPTRKKVRGGNEVLPIMHPGRSNEWEKDPELIWEDTSKQNIPVDCMTDWYYDENDVLKEPGSDRRCAMVPGQYCREEKRRAVEGGSTADQPPPRLHERHARTLVNDKNRRGLATSTKELCESPHSVGPSYANHHERFFCRMTDKTLWPFCDRAAGVSHDCFDAEAEILVEKNKPIGKRSHHWDAIEDWHSEKRSKRAA